jgi:hypothetical protein
MSFAPAPGTVRANDQWEVRTMRKFFGWGGVVASIVLIAFGIGSLVVGFGGRSDVQSSITREQIVGTPDMTPSAITAEAKKAGLNVSSLDIPSKSVANEPISTGAEARTFAGYMRIHALEATGGYTYAQMGRYEAKPGTPGKFLAVGGGTDDPAHAVVDPKTKQPVSNGTRDVWVTETALTTALNTSYFAERVADFSIIMGAALLLTGIGFLVLTLGGALGALRLPNRRSHLGTAPRAT